MIDTNILIYLINYVWTISWKYSIFRRCFLYDSAEQDCTTSYTPRWPNHRNVNHSIEHIFDTFSSSKTPSHFQWNWPSWLWGFTRWPITSETPSASVQIDGSRCAPKCSAIWAKPCAKLPVTLLYVEMLQMAGGWCCDGVSEGVAVHHSV